MLPKNAIERKWRWDAQPVYKHSPYQAGRSCGQDHDSTMEKTPVKIFKYKNHITHVSAAEIPTWYACMFDCGSCLASMHNNIDDACGHGRRPRGSPRRASGAPSCYPSCGSTSDFDAARTPTSATIKRNRGTPFSHAGTPKEGMTPRPATTSRDNIGMSQKVGASAKDALSTIARTPSATTTKEGYVLRFLAFSGMLQLLRFLAIFSHALIIDTRMFVCVYSFTSCIQLHGMDPKWYAQAHHQWQRPHRTGCGRGQTNNSPGTSGKHARGRACQIERDENAVHRKEDFNTLDSQWSIRPLTQWACSRDDERSG